MPTEKKTLRMDFRQEVVDFDKETGRFTAKLTFDPKRYERKAIDGKEGYLDKFDKVFIPIDLLKEIAGKMVNQRIFYSPPEINNADDYILGRMKDIKDYFQNNYEHYKYNDKSEAFLQSLEKDKQRFVILSIDLKGSTKLSQELSSEDNSKIISLYLREMTLLVDKFRGFVLKYVGDGLIAYFPEPNFIGMNDNAIYCALTMKKMIVYAINPVLKELKFPELNFRIGIDSGEAMIKTLGVANIKMHKDLIGATVNIAAKIQSLAKDKQILLGESTALNVHTFWRGKIKKSDIPEGWSYKDKETGEPYQIYHLLEELGKKI